MLCQKQDRKWKSVVAWISFVPTHCQLQMSSVKGTGPCAHRLPCSHAVQNCYLPCEELLVVLLKITPVLKFHLGSSSMLISVFSSGKGVTLIYKISQSSAIYVQFF